MNEVPFEAETWGMPIEHEPEHIPEIPPDLNQSDDPDSQDPANDIECPNCGWVRRPPLVNPFDLNPTEEAQAETIHSLAIRFTEQEAELARAREAIRTALSTTWTPDDEGGWGTEEDQLYPDALLALAALIPHWERWGDEAWGLAGRAEAELARLRPIVRHIAGLVGPETGFEYCSVNRQLIYDARAALESPVPASTESEAER